MLFEMHQYDIKICHYNMTVLLLSHVIDHNFII